MYEQSEFISEYVQKPYSLKHFNSLTNYVYLVELDNQKLIYRQYSDYFQIFQNRNREIQITHQLSKLGFAPHVLKADEHQRIEEYLPYDSTNLKEMKENYLEIAELLAHFHKLTKIPDIHNLFENKEPIIKQHLQNKKLRTTIFDVIQAQTQTNKKKKQKIINQFQYVFSDQIQQQLNDLFESDCLTKLDLVLAHNDLNSTNFLRDQDGKFHLIDFEYSGLNYPGYEIANFFNEMEWDYTYQKEPFFSVSEELGLSNQQKQEFIQRYWFVYAGNNEVPQALYQQIQIGSILQNYFWLLIGALSLQFKEQTICLHQYISQRIQNLNKIFL